MIRSDVSKTHLLLAVLLAILSLLFLLNQERIEALIALILAIIVLLVSLLLASQKVTVVTKKKQSKKVAVKKTSKKAPVKRSHLGTYNTFVATKLTGERSHRATCFTLKNSKRSDLIYFKNREQARKENYSECGVCKPYQ